MRKTMIKPSKDINVSPYTPINHGAQSHFYFENNYLKVH